MGVVEDANEWIQEEFTNWAIYECPSALRQAIDDVCTPGAHRTKTLAASVGSRRVSEDLFHVGTAAYYGGYVNDGRGVAKPHGNYKLHWISPAGKDVFAKQSGPSRPRNFIAAAVAKLS